MSYILITVLIVLIILLMLKKKPIQINFNIEHTYKQEQPAMVPPTPQMLQTAEEQKKMFETVTQVVNSALGIEMEGIDDGSKQEN